MKKSLILIISVILLALSACAPKEELPALKVGMDLRYPPFETVDSSGAASGISVDIAKELGKFLDREVEIVDLPFGSLITSLQTGEIDIIIASMSITPARQETANEFIASMESEGVNTRLREKYNPILLSEYLLEEGFDLFLTSND